MTNTLSSNTAHRVRFASSYRALLVIPALVAAAALLAGCYEELGDLDVCTTNSDCATEQECTDIDNDTGEGHCSALGAPDDCDNSSDCGSDEICLARACIREDDLCTSNADCATGFECTIATAADNLGQCTRIGGVGACSVDADCSSSQVCINRECEVASSGSSWPYVAVMSATTSPVDLYSTNTPGPDIDTVELISRGQSRFATTVEAFRQGDGGDTGGNVNAVVVSVLGANDAIPSFGGDCDLREESGFWSMGDSTGFVVVSFGNEAPVNGDVIRIWELDDLICDNVATVRADTYEVMIGSDDVDIVQLASVQDLSGEDWLYIGAAAGTGGVAEFVVDLP